MSSCPGDKYHKSLLLGQYAHESLIRMSLETMFQTLLLPTLEGLTPTLPSTVNPVDTYIKQGFHNFSAVP